MKDNQTHAFSVPGKLRIIKQQNISNMHKNVICVIIFNVFHSTRPMYIVLILFDENTVRIMWNIQLCYDASALPAAQVMKYALASHEAVASHSLRELLQNALLQDKIYMLESQLSSKCYVRTGEISIG